VNYTRVLGEDNFTRTLFGSYGLKIHSLLRYDAVATCKPLPSFQGRPLPPSPDMSKKKV